MNKTLYVTDLDGTLMRNDKSISEATITILNNLIKQGVLVTYATARSINSASEITKDIDFHLPVIIRNGTILADPKTREEIDIAKFSQEDLQSIQHYMKGLELYGFATTYINGKENKLYLEGKQNEGFSCYLEEHSSDKRLRGVGSVRDFFYGEICYFTFIGTREELDPFYERLKESNDWICVYQQDKYRPEYWLEICPKNASKAMAIQRLKKKYYYDKLVVFGDSLNDISMFEVAEEAYAVDNAMDEVKVKATSVILSNEEDGVAKWLESKFKRHPVL